MSFIFRIFAQVLTKVTKVTKVWMIQTKYKHIKK